jgi:hypothetical protein
MKALTLHQPWATLMAIGAKRIETRSWSTNYRGPLAIHAATTYPKYAKDFCCSDALHKAMGWPDIQDFPSVLEWKASMDERILAMPIGAIVGVCDLVDCFSTSRIAEGQLALIHQEDEFGDYSPARYGWLTEKMKALAEPIPVRGAQRLWNWDEAGLFR